MTTTFRKEIVFDRETRDYRMELDGQFVGFKSTYHEAEVELDRLAYEIAFDHFEHGLTDDPPPGFPEDDDGSEDGGGPPRYYLTDSSHDTPILEDVARVLDMALGKKYGPKEIIAELRRVRTRIDQAVTLV